LTEGSGDYRMALLTKMTTNKYDVIIVGGGPAGIFAALELCQCSDLRILLVEKGQDIDQRTNLVCGLGGAGAYSDGKLTLTPEVGGRLTEYLSDHEICALIEHVDAIYRRFGAPEQIYGMGDDINRLRRQSSLPGLRLVPVPVRHLGTDRCRAILRAMRDHLAPRLEIRLETNAATVTTRDHRATGIVTADGENIAGDHLILAPGREGADWLATEAKRLGLTLYNNPVDVGVRVELPAAVTNKLTDILYEAKLEYLTPSFDDRIRTFCMCPAGEVTMETTGGSDPVITVNGHSYADSRSQNTNFALLVSTDFTKPFHEPIAYGKYLARLANILSGGVLVQRLGDLMAGRRSTPARIARGMVKPTLKEATPGDLSFVMPYRHLTDIIEMLQAMNKIAPGVAAKHTLLYGVEVKFYSCRLHLSPGLETEIENMFAVGDGAGVSRGLIQSSVSGIIAARQILKRLRGH